jgi:hypothetical protein
VCRFANSASRVFGIKATNVGSVVFLIYGSFPDFRIGVDLSTQPWKGKTLDIWNKPGQAQDLRIIG